ncbi:D-inositol 3-phosphate glycosyltransferase [Micromonospora noduli]|uniref:D-inositol 3-phosphate glycosyltransferase n=1 Tax=Micromonospora noduli TaxID=709876 RepID=A0ABX9D5I4_9ACTN|nr:glycosyltransferase [Micromonospora noduli]RAO22680.1 D-inositol 3-phosphate glycosyltransferase [Micromonospora noduli]
MRIAHVSDSHLTNPEGVATSVGTTVALLRAAGHRVVLHCPGPLSRCRRRPGEVPSLSVPTRPYRLALPRAPSAPVDVVHVHTTGPLGVAGLRWAATRGVPTVLTWHTDLVAYAAHYPEIPIGAAYAGLRLGLRWRAGDLWALAHPGPGRQARLAALGRTLLAHTTVLIAPSAKTAAMMATMAGRTPILVLPTPAAAPHADADDRRRLRARLGIPADAPVLLAVGRATPEKNPELLLAAFAQVRRELPAARLVLLGARRHRLSVRRMARRYGVTGALHLLRPVPRHLVGGYYRAADLLAFASTTRPVAEPSPAAFGALLTRLLTERELRGAVIRDGRAAATDWSAERYLAELVRLYASLPPVGTARAAIGKARRGDAEARSERPVGPPPVRLTQRRTG